MWQHTTPGQFTHDQTFNSAQMYYQNDLDAIMKGMKYQASDHSLNLQKNVLQVSSDDNFGFSQGHFGNESQIINTPDHYDIGLKTTYLGATDQGAPWLETTNLGAMGLGATDKGATWLGETSLGATRMGATRLEAMNLEEETGISSDLRQIAESLLPQEDSFPLMNDDYTASLDTMHLDSLDIGGPSLEELMNEYGGLDGGLTNGLNGDLESGVNVGLGQAGPRTTSCQQTARSRRPRRTTKPAATTTNPQVAHVMQDMTENQHSALGLDKDRAPRQRQPRVSHITLTEEQSKERYRELNNVASRVYRQKKGDRHDQMQQQVVQERRRNQQLRKKVQGFQQLRQQMEEYTQTFMRQHMGGRNIVPHASR